MKTWVCYIKKLEFWTINLATLVKRGEFRGIRGEGIPMDKSRGFNIEKEVLRGLLTPETLRALCLAQARFRHKSFFLFHG